MTYVDPKANSLRLQTVVTLNNFTCVKKTKPFALYQKHVILIKAVCLGHI